MIDQILAFIHNLYAVPDIIGWGGYLVLFAIIFAETGLLIGFFLPGDSLLITAGLFAAAGKLDIFWLIAVLVPAAIVGDTAGYWFGHKIGRRLYERENSKIFKKKHLLKAKAFYDKHGGKTIVIARFMPFIRTFAPIVAGTAEMQYRKFAFFNIAGGILWVMSMLLAGFLLGSIIPDIENSMGLLIILVIFLSILPGAISYLREKQKSRAEPPIPA